MVGWLEQPEHGIGRGQAAGEGQPVLDPFQGGQALLQGGARRVGAAAVLIAPMLPHS
jgi:hypothetical protein